MSSPFVPSAYTGSYWESIDNPEVVIDQHFGIGMFDKDLNPPLIWNGNIVLRRTAATIESSGHSVVKNMKNMYLVRLSVKYFKPCEIDVKVVDNYIVIHGKHEEMSDDHGLVKREFTRRYELPRGTEAETVKSSMSSDGILTIEAPKKEIETSASSERVVPISLTSEDKTTG